MGALDRRMGDQIAEVEDHPVLEVEDDLRHWPTDGILDLVQPALRLLVVDAVAGGVSHLADPAGELVPPTRGAVAGPTERVLRAGSREISFAQADCCGQIAELACGPRT